jgi:hypothetical protein
MLYKIAPEQLSVMNCFGIKLDRIIFFVNQASEIKAFRGLNFHHFEFSVRNWEQGTVSNIFFFKDICLELIEIENQELATQHSAQFSIDLISRTQWRSNQALPFGFVLSYAVSQKHESRRRCYHIQPEINGRQPSLEVNFSVKNLEKLEEPACYIVPEAFTAENLLDSSSMIKQRLLRNRSKMSKLTAIQITLDSSISLTRTVSFISDLDLVNVKRGNYPKLELKFGSSNKGLSTSFDSIPVVFHY